MPAQRVAKDLLCGITDNAKLHFHGLLQPAGLPNCTAREIDSCAPWGFYNNLLCFMCGIQRFQLGNSGQVDINSVQSCGACVCVCVCGTSEQT